MFAGDVTVEVTPARDHVGAIGCADGRALGWHGQVRHAAGIHKDDFVSLLPVDHEQALDHVEQAQVDDIGEESFANFSSDAIHRMLAEFD